jgi:hypothetical protein
MCKKGYEWNVATDYTGGFDFYRDEIDCGRPVKVDFLYWNPIPTGIKIIDPETGESIYVYDFGPQINSSHEAELPPDDIEEKWRCEDPNDKPERCIGHAVTGVGYMMLDYDPDGPDGPLTEGYYAIVHDNWPSTAVNVAIPWKHWLASISVDVLPPHCCLRGELGDVSGDGTVSPKDAGLILQFVVGIIDCFPPNCEEAPTGRIPQNYKVSIPHLSVTQGKRVTVPISIDESAFLSSGALALHYDRTVLRATTVYPAEILSDCYWASNLKATDFGLEQQVNTVSPGEVRIAFASPKPENGKGTLFYVEFEALSNTDGRTSPLTLDIVQLSESHDIAIQHGLVNVLPAQTMLLQNYPNPFNPETWLPYKLSEASDAILRIYDVQGRLIRTIVLGHKAAGIYVQKGEAAYWDGKDNFGEPVASGVYFYTLEAGNYKAARKLVVQK